MAKKRIKLEAKKIKPSMLGAIAAWSVFLLVAGGVGSQVINRADDLPPMVLNDRIEIAQMRFGMREEAVRAIYSDAEELPFGRDSIIAFDDADARYHVWFSPTELGKTLYRIRFERAYDEGISENQVLEKFAKTLGRPLVTGCHRPSQLERQCGYQWWGGNGVRIDANISSTKSLLGTERIIVSFTALDTVLEQRMARVELVSLR